MSVVASGTVTTDGTEQTLSIQTAAGVYQLVVDRNAMLAADGVILRSKTKVLTGGTVRLFQKRLLRGAPADDTDNEYVSSLEPVPSVWSATFTLEHKYGTTGIAIPWELHSI